MNNIKNNIIIVLMAIVIASFFIIEYEGGRVKKLNKKATELEATITNLNQELDVKTAKLDSAEVMVAETKTLQVTQNNIEASHGKVLEATKTKVKYVDRIVSVSTTIHDVDTITCLVDSFGGLRAHYKDEFASILVDVDSARKAAIDYSVRDSLTIINYQKKHSLLFGLIKWKSHEGCKVINHNPKSTPTTLVSYQVMDK